jgi:hypothetical protein
MSWQLCVTSRHVFADTLEFLVTIGEERDYEFLVLHISFARSRFGVTTVSEVALQLLDSQL